MSNNSKDAKWKRDINRFQHLKDCKASTEETLAYYNKKLDYWNKELQLIKDKYPQYLKDEEI